AKADRQAPERGAGQSGTGADAGPACPPQGTAQRRHEGDGQAAAQGQARGQAVQGQEDRQVTPAPSPLAVSRGARNRKRPHSGLIPSGSNSSRPCSPSPVKKTGSRE